MRFVAVIKSALCALVASSVLLGACSGGGGGDSFQLSRLEIQPAAPTLARGTSLTLQVVAVYQSGGTAEVSDQATWQSSNPAVAAVSNDAATRGRLTALSVGTTTLTTAFAGLTATATVTVTPATATALAITPSPTTVALDASRQFTATATFSDGTTQNVTGDANWSSVNPAIATVSNVDPTKGLAQGIARGQTQVAASYVGLNASATLAVTGAVLDRLEVTPSNPTIAKGTSRQFTAIAVFDDATTQDVSAQAEWSSSSPAVATVGNGADDKGLALAVDIGTTTVSASYLGRTGATLLTVSDVELARIEVTPTNRQVPVGRTQQYAATGVYTDGATQDLTGDVAWTSSDTAVIEIGNGDGNRGFAVAKAVGAASISATFDGKSGSTGVEVTSAVLNAIQVTPSASRVAVGFSRQYTATGLFSDSSTRDITADVTWTTSDATLATISNADGSRGLASGVSAGTVSIGAQQGTVSGSTLLTVTTATLNAIEVSPAVATIPLGTDRQFSATGTFSDSSTQDLTTQVAWASSDAAIATISNVAGSQGMASSESVGGPIDITATHAGSGVSDTASLTVSNAALTAIAVAPATATIAKGSTRQYTATGSFTDGSTADLTATATWISSDTAVATVSNAAGSNGLATGVAVGTAMISASSSGIAGSASLSVSAATLTRIDVTPSVATVAKGVQQQFVATGTYSDSTTQNLTTLVTWMSSAPSVATVGSGAEGGLATGLAVGSATITAVMGAIQDNAELTVTAAELRSIAIQPANPMVAAGTSLQLSAVGTYSDGSTLDLTTSVTWASADTTLAEVSNGAASKGLALGKAPGAVGVSASDPATMIAGAATLTVTDAVLRAITIAPANATLPIGFGRQLTATGQFSDGSSRDITTQVSWSSLSPAIVSVSDAANRKGFATGVAAGTTTVVARLNDLVGSTGIGAASIALNSIAVTPADASVSGGQTLQYTAIGNFADGSALDLTTQVFWASSNTRVATISNAEGSQGLASSGSLVGSTTISATSGSVSGTATLRRTL